MGFRGLVLVAMVAIGCEQPKKLGTDAAPTQDACTDLSCFVVDCQSKGLPPTTITGTVFAPNGTLPLYGVNVYVPATDPGPLAPGVQCDRCALGLPGGAVTSVVTDEAGNFRLENVPATADVPIVVQSGKWRRQFKIPAVAACQDNAIAKADTTLPKNRTEGDLPKIAITTGNADALECLIRKLGIDDSEFGTSGDDRSVHLYHGNGVSSFAGGFAGGTGALAPAKPFWDTPSTLATYDIVLLSCEGDQLIDAAGGATVGINDKPQTSLQAVHDYANVGGRVFMSHWHNVWIGGDRRATPTVGLADWKSIITWAFGAPQTDTVAQISTVDESTVPPPAIVGGLPNPKGTSFATWMMNVGGSTTRNEVSVNNPRYTASAIANPPLAERWVYVDPAKAVLTSGNPPTPVSGVQDALFTTPIDVPEDQRCGKAVFSDMHVASGSTSPAGGTFPTSCATTDLTPQEKALAFIFFDISTCVGVLQ